VPGSIACPCVTASTICPSISTAPLGNILVRAIPTCPTSTRRESCGNKSASFGNSPRNAFPIGVFGQTLNASAISVGTAKTVTTANTKPIVGPVVALG
jgi:hypothetical protein